MGGGRGSPARCVFVSYCGGSGDRSSNGVPAVADGVSGDGVGGSAVYLGGRALLNF